MSTTARERQEVLYRLGQAGVSYQDACALRRISMTLSRWGEMECGTEQGCIERDETTGKPYFTYDSYDGKRKRRPVPDRERGALKRLAAIMQQYPNFYSYYQTDPRVASLYLVRKDDVPSPDKLDSYYSHGIAIY